MTYQQSLQAAVKKVLKPTAPALKKIHREAIKIDTLYFLHQRLMNHLTRRLFPQFESPVTTDDWKYLIVLDACRFDAFQQQCELDGELRKVNSNSAWTKEWSIRNFSGGDWSDTMYISASGWTNAAQTRLDGDPFHTIKELWDVDMDVDDEAGLAAIQPDLVRKVATQSIAENPKKRAIIHFQQPHNPLIGEDSIPRDSFESNGTVYDALRNGELSKQRVWEAYLSNLQLALDEVDELLKVLDGKVVITADHGECFGEFGLFEHPGALVKPILEVPWFEIEKDRDVEPAVVAEGMEEVDTDVDEANREEHLRQLGYLD